MNPAASVFESDSSRPEFFDGRRPVLYLKFIKQFPIIVYNLRCKVQGLAQLEISYNEQNCSSPFSLLLLDAVFEKIV
jgi:hypothetical protein